MIYIRYPSPGQYPIEIVQNGEVIATINDWRTALVLGLDLAYAGDAYRRMADLK